MDISSIEGQMEKIVKVEWLDSRQLSGWIHNDAEAGEGICQCQSVGYLIEDTDEYITLTLGISEGQHLHEVCIPKASVVKVTEL